MKQSKSTDSEVLEQINMLVAIISIAIAVSCGAAASIYIFSAEQHAYVQFATITADVGQVITLPLIIMMFWKYRLIKHLPFSTLMAGRKVPVQDDGFMEVILTRATTNSWLLTIVSLATFIVLTKDNMQALSPSFYLLALLALSTSSYGISYIVMYLRETKASAKDSSYE